MVASAVSLHLAAPRARAATASRGPSACLAPARAPAPSGRVSSAPRHWTPSAQIVLQGASVRAPLSRRARTAARAVVRLPTVMAADGSGSKVVVLGGNGFVGGRVCKALVGAGATVVSVSRSGLPPAWADGEEWTNSVEWASGDVLADDLSDVLAGSAAVVSCIGTIGGSDESMLTGNGANNEAAAQKAKAAGAARFVYVSVASIVEEVVSKIAMKGYFEGKKAAEDACYREFPGSAVIVKPSFIYGGEEFGIAPPRVTKTYGGFIESLLSLGPVRSLAKVAPGPIALTLAPPVSVDNVAAAAAAGALGALPPGVIDGTDAINEAALSL